MDNIADVLSSLRERGVRLWLEGDQLRYKAPVGALTQEDIDRLRASKRTVIDLLLAFEEPREGAPVLVHEQVRRAPLTFAQLAHWHAYRLSERRAIRQIASATRVVGHFNVELFKRSASEIVRRSDALRTVIVVANGVPTQEMSSEGVRQVRVEDWTGRSKDVRDMAVQETIDRLVLEPIDIAVGPLFEMRLLKILEDEHVIVVVMDHMISDAYSMNILLRDTFAAYVQAIGEGSISLPPMPLQYADYAVCQRRGLEAWKEEHEAYWTQRLAGCHRQRFPNRRGLQCRARPGWGTVHFSINRRLKAALRDWSRTRKTTLVMSIFTAYVALVMRWCGTSESVVQYQSDGRVSPSVQDTIGFFATVLYLRISVLEADSFVDLLNRVTQEYCQAYEHADFSYLSAKDDVEGFTRNTTFNWVPQGSKIDVSRLAGSADEISLSSVGFTHPTLKQLELDYEPVMLLYDADDEVIGNFQFPLGQFTVESMERLAQAFLVYLNALVEQPERKVQEVVLPEC
ncbi:condensation domain-containing protein [Peristeroidobacter soli]|uniref:condensation domain-containing protein n=1 Tax=Peristeroidobacter soli TaxID=2497877 RepID=UPI00101E1F01|nr:condensation domain-containing protein [Peristeroidobacter soli]